MSFIFDSRPQAYKCRSHPMPSQMYEEGEIENPLYELDYSIGHATCGRPDRVFAKVAMHGRRMGCASAVQELRMGCALTMVTLCIGYACAMHQLHMGCASTMQRHGLSMGCDAA